MVIGIIGLLASIITINLTSARKRARDTKRIGDLRSIQAALEDYYGKNGQYPASLGDLVSTYLPIRPTDPLGSTCAVAAGNSNDCYFYAYYPTSGIRYSYHVGASLEDQGSMLLNQDRDCISTSGTSCPYTAAYSSGFNGADTTACDSGAARYCYDIAQ